MEVKKEVNSLGSWKLKRTIQNTIVRFNSLLVFTFYLLVAPATQAQSYTSCPTVNDLGTARVICTSGPFGNPYRDTGIVSTYHTVQSGYVRIGHTVVDTNGFGVSATWIYRVDTTQIHVLLIRHLVNLNSIGQTPPDSLSFSEIVLQDSTGNALAGDDSCHHIRFTYHDGHGTTTTANNGNVTYSTPSRYYAFDLRHFHGQTLRIHFRAGKPQGVNTRCFTRIQFSCLRLDSITTQYSCYQGYSHTLPDGFQYEWYRAAAPDSVLGTARTFVPHNIDRYGCRLTSYTGCPIDTFTTVPITHRESAGQLVATLVDTVDADTTCHVRYRITPHFTTTVTTSAGDTTVIRDDTTVTHWHTLDGQRLHDTVTFVSLAPGSHTITLAWVRTPGCTNTASRTVFVSRLACHYYDSIYSSCPSVYDLGNPRTACTFGTWSSGNIVEQQGLNPLRHELITSPGYDNYTGLLLPTIPPGESASIKLGNNDSQSQFESVTFFYKVDTTQSDLLILRYAAVLENPNHGDSEQPKFTFEILDSTGTPINSDCYSASYIASTSLGWNTSPTIANVLWKDWTTIGADLSGVHGQLVSIRLTTYDCSLGAHFGYAYFTLGCHQRQIQATHCQDTSYYSAPDGFTYEWYPDGQPNNIVATTRDFTTVSHERFHCRLGFIGAPAGTDCHTLISTSAPLPQYPVSQFTIDTIDTVDCHLRLRLVADSRIVTEYSSDSLVSEPASQWQFFVDSLPHVADTLIVTLVPGTHTLRLVTGMPGRPCTDTLTRTLLVDPICHLYDTLTVCPEQFPITIEDSTIYGDTTLYIDHGDTLIYFTVIVGQQTHITLADTIVENQLPWRYRDVIVSNPAGIDTLLILPGSGIVNPGSGPECDTHLHYNLFVWPNKIDSAYFYLCPSTIPFRISDNVSITGDTVVVFRGQHGEDSVVHYRVTRLADSDTILLDTILEKQLPWFFLDSIFTAGSFASYADTLSALFSLVNEQGCDSLIHYTLHIYWDGDHCDTTLTFPTLVTPNADGINDRFVIGGLLENNCFKFNELIIYDRTGRLVYHARNIAQESDWWDPAAEHAPDATYFYVFKAHGVKIHTMHQGVIEVLR